MCSGRPRRRPGETREVPGPSLTLRTGLGTALTLLLTPPLRAAHNGAMLVTRRELPILVVNLIYIPAFTLIAFRGRNYEFLLYAGIVLLAAALVLWRQRTVKFTPLILWGLTIWGLLHMAGGNIRVAGDVLYGFQLIPVFMRYDQFVHALGFGTATLVCYHLLLPYLKPEGTSWGMLAVLIVLMGCGVGALNETVEFLAVLIMPETGVGGYDNTMWDLVFNLIGALIAVGYLTWQRARRPVG